MQLMVAFGLFLLVALYCGGTVDGAAATGILGPQSVRVPINSTAAFNCTIMNSEGVRWYVALPNTYPRIWPQDADFLRGNASINVTTNNVTAAVQSTLYIMAINRTNGTTVVCTRSTDASMQSLPASLIVYDRPSPPTNVRTRALGELQLEISWNASITVPGVYPWYRVHVTDPTEQSDILDVIVGSGNTSYQYHHSQGNPCHLYQFAVLAVNAAGESDPGDLVASSIPAVPVLTNATSVVYLTPSVSIHVLIKSMFSCANFTTQGYHIQLQDLISTFILNLPPYPSGSDEQWVELVINATAGLRTDTKYIIAVSGFNSVGQSSNISLLVYTTDVQSSNITGSDHQLNVTCFFAEGTQARGCAVCLEKSGEVVYQMVPRVNETAEGVIRTEFSVDCYNISVVDWEEDGSTGSLGVPMNLSVYPEQGGPLPSSSQVGTITDRSPVSNSVSILIPLLIGVLVAMATFLCVAILITLIVLSKMKRNVLGVSNATFTKEKAAAYQTAAVLQKCGHTEEAEERIYDTVTESSGETSTCVGKTSSLECPSYAVLDSAYQPVGSSSKMAAPMYSEIPSLQQPNRDAAHTGDPEPYLCVSQIVGTQEHPHTEHLNLEHTHGGVCNSVSVV